MRTRLLAASVAALALAPGTHAAPGTLPSLRFLDLSPVKVRGEHFVARERVHLTLRAGSAKRVRTVRVSAKGAFTVSFGTLDERDRCSSLVAIAAAGARGDRAAYRLPRSACPVMASGPFR